MWSLKKLKLEIGSWKLAVEEDPKVLLIHSNIRRKSSTGPIRQDQRSSSGHPETLYIKSSI
jgi:hypothetical protein